MSNCIYDNDCCELLAEFGIESPCRKDCNENDPIAIKKMLAVYGIKVDKATLDLDEMRRKYKNGEITYDGTQETTCGNMIFCITV